MPLSGKNAMNKPVSWFAGAGYQHGMAQDAAAFGAPVIDCDIHWSYKRYKIFLRMAQLS